MFFYVVMPVGSNPNKDKYQKLISEVACEYGMRPHFPCYATEDPVFNLQSTLQDFRGCEFVLADLSFERPSCYYELGLAEALGKQVYLVALKGSIIHQTASRRLVKFYKSNEELLALFREILSEAVSESD
jgi:nucleoside 2-deoxyribosyltransferase